MFKKDDIISLKLVDNRVIGNFKLIEIGDLFIKGYIGRNPMMVNLNSVATIALQGFLKR